MTELVSKRSLLSSRSTDAKSSETPVADDVSPSAARSSKKNKKMKRELWESVFSLVSLVLSVSTRK